MSIALFFVSDSQSQLGGYNTHIIFCRVRFEQIVCEVAESRSIKKPALSRLGPAVLYCIMLISGQLPCPSIFRGKIHMVIPVCCRFSSREETVFSFQPIGLCWRIHNISISCRSGNWNVRACSLRGHGACSRRSEGSSCVGV